MLWLCYKCYGYVINFVETQIVARTTLTTSTENADFIPRISQLCVNEHFTSV